MEPDSSDSPKRWLLVAMFEGGTILDFSHLDAARLAHNLEKLVDDVRRGQVRRVIVEEESS